MIKQFSLALALVGTLGLAAAPGKAFHLTSVSEVGSTFMTGAVLLLLASAARRLRVAKS
jgi:hypothetical protein